MQKIIIYFVLLLKHGNTNRKLKDSSQKPKKIIATEGENVVLPCGVLGSEVQVQWMANGFGLGYSRELPSYHRYQYLEVEDQTGDTSWDLQITGVVLADDGQYQCLVGGRVASLVELIVLVETSVPQILQGEEVEVVKGREEVLQCMAEGKPPPELEWKDEQGRLLQASEESKTIKLSDNKRFRTISVIKLLPKKIDNHRNLSCIASNSAASDAKSSQVMLLVMYKPEVSVTQTSTEGGGKPGDTFTFRCHAQASPEVTSIEWFVNEAKLPDETGDMLMLEVSSDLNGASVQCQARNVIGLATDETKIQLKSGPLITLNPQSQIAQEEEKVTLKCQAEGNPRPSYFWTRGLSHKVGDGNTLTLLASHKTTGLYYCHALVEGFEVAVSEPAELQVAEIPEIEIANKFQFGAIGEKVEIKCEVFSLSKSVTINWEKHGRPIGRDRFSVDKEKKDQITSILSIHIEDESDFGDITCTARNEVGLSFKTVSLQKKEENLTSTTALYIAIVVLFIVIVILIACLSLIYYKNLTKADVNVDTPAKEKTPPIARNRFGQPDLLNNNDNLLRDLLSTKIKGVDENSRNILNQVNPVAGRLVQPLFPSLPLDESSRRSSLLSFFQDPPTDQESGPTLINDISLMPPIYPCDTPSILTDSGVYSPPLSADLQTGQKQEVHISVSRNHSWRLRENVNEDEIDPVMITSLTSFETTV